MEKAASVRKPDQRPCARSSTTKTSVGPDDEVWLDSQCERRRIVAPTGCLTALAAYLRNDEDLLRGRCRSSILGWKDSCRGRVRQSRPIVGPEFEGQRVRTRCVRPGRSKQRTSSIGWLRHARASCCKRCRCHLHPGARRCHTNTRTRAGSAVLCDRGVRLHPGVWSSALREMRAWWLHGCSDLK